MVSSWRLFGSQKFVWGGWSFLRFKEKVHTGELHMDSPLKNWLAYWFFHFLNLARLYGCIILTVFSCIYYYIGDMCFQNLNMTKKKFKYRILYLFFGCDEFLPWLRITVALITYVMQAVSFVLLDLLLCIMTCICTILCYSVFENVSIIISSRFEKSEVFINHISKSRNRDFCSEKVEEGGHFSYQEAIAEWRWNT